ncbi:hypothetical protein TRFO_18972 [Tritrichomonas foetus]|uniref:Uncharacterized protein n=1 Tax=Tritrichomonas foetus TaxID=1144522 RepID=A0A1J4KJN0_9EUKA|nr:hypothetical protein TRFO_18972 [Tritrichomonas foetus]|eukprot:OHT11527.1 hypothetical protein TRFO_18972 [Tritrichomonas foetus]
MVEVDEILSSLKEMRHQQPNGQEINQQLIKIQNQVKYKNFQKYPSDKIISIFSDIWLFLLYTSSQTSNNTIRITAIRTAAIFLFNLGPFFPKEIRDSFATITTVSTIDMTGSSLIASVFAIITYHISPPFRTSFLTSCPIFHHITQVHTCPEYFISSLSHYQHLGFNWHRMLTNSFLVKTMGEENDKLYWRAIVTIVSNNVDLFPEVFKAIIENNFYQQNIFFMASLLKIPQAPIDSVDLYDVAKFALKSLEKVTELTCNEKCSILKILSLKNSSFFTEIVEETENSLIIKIVRNTNSEKTESFEQKIQISTLESNPEFYSLNLPVDLLFPKDDEGSTLLAAKMTALVAFLRHSNPENLHQNPINKNDDLISFDSDSMSQKNPTNTQNLENQDKFESKLDDLTERIMNTIKEMASKPYDSTVSACFQGISNSAHLIKNKKILNNLMRILHCPIFSESQSWFHDMDRLKILRSLPLDIILDVIGMNQIYILFDHILGWSKEKNEKLSQYAREVVVSFIAQSDKEVLIERVIKKCDIFDSYDLIRTLQLLNLYLKNNRRTLTLQGFCTTICQMISIYNDNAELYIEICQFLTFFMLKKMKPATFNICMSIILASYRIVTGLPVAIKSFDEGLIEDACKMIESYQTKLSLNIVFENYKEYTDVNLPLARTLELLYSLKSIELSYIEPIIQYTYQFFPHEATRLLYKYWDSFKNPEKVNFLINYSDCIKYDASFKSAGLWFDMFMKTVDDSNYTALHPIKVLFREYLRNSHPYFFQIDDEVLLKFLLFYKYIHPKRVFDYSTLPEPKRTRMIELVNNEQKEQVKIENPPETFVKIDFVFVPPKIRNLEQLNKELTKKLPKNDPLIEIQLKYDLYEYPEDEIKNMFHHYSKDKVFQSITAVIIDYSKRHKIDLNIQPFSFEDLKKKEKVKKSDLLNNCLLITQSQPSDSIPFILNLINETTKEDKLQLLLILMRNILNEIDKKIGYGIAKNVIFNFNENFSKLPKGELSSALIPLCRKVKKAARPIKFLNRLSTILTMESIGGINVIESRSLCHDLLYNDMKIILKNSFDHFLPSMYRFSVRLLISIAQTHANSGIDLLSNFMRYFVHVNEKYSRLEPIHRDINELFEIIFQSENFSYINQMINLSITNFIVPKNSTIVSYSTCIPPILKYLSMFPGIDPFSNLPPVSKFTSFEQAFFEIIGLKIDRITNKKEIALKEAESFVESTGRIPIYRLSKYVFLWINFLIQYFQFRKVIDILLPLSQVRFNSFYIGFINYVRLHKNAINNESNEDINDETNDKINQGLSDEDLQRLTTKWKIEAHSKAFEYFLSGNEELQKAGIKLSYFQEDCEASFEIINECETVYSQIKSSKTD